MLLVVCNLDWIIFRLGSDAIAPVSAFKAARLFSPYKTNEIQPSYCNKY